MRSSTVSPLENPHRRRLFRQLFLATSFSNTDHTIRCARRRSSSFVKAPERESQSRTDHASFFSDGLNLTCRRARVGGSTFRQRASTSSLAWRRLATLHLCLCHPSPASAFFGVFVSAGPLNSLSGDLQWLPLHPEPYTCLRKCSSTLPVVPHLIFFTIWSLIAADPRFFFFQPRSEAVLGLSSIQTYFVLQISRYDY